MKRWCLPLMLMLLLPAAVFSQPSGILYIDDDAGRTDWSNNKPLSEYFTEGLDRLGLDYNYWNVLDSTFRPDSLTLVQYDLVIWDQPEYYGHYTTPLTDADTASIGYYLQMGGKLWAHTPDLVMAYLWVSAPQCPSWLHITSYSLDWVNEAVPLDSIVGETGDPIGDGLIIDTDPGNHVEGDYTDRLRPAPGAVGCLTGPYWDSNWHQDSTFYCAIRFDSVETGQQLFYMATAFQGIPSQADRDTLMARVLAWFGLDLSANKDAAITRIVSPGDIAPTNSQVPVRIDVRSNNINDLSDVWVCAVIESLPGYPVYSESTLVASIPGLSTYIASLPNWQTQGIDTVAFTAWVSVPGDIDPSNDTLTKQVLVLPVIYLTDFEEGSGRWVGDWSMSDEYAYSGDNSFTDRPYQNYPVNSDLCSILDTTFDLAGYVSAALSFTHRFWLENGYDFGYVLASGDGGATWDSLGGYTGSGPTDTIWHSASVDLTPYVGSSQFMFGFRLGSDPLHNMKGWYIDDVVLSASTAKQVMGTEGSPVEAGFGNRLLAFGPNPLKDKATVRYQVAKTGTPVTVRAYNLAGQMIKELVSGTASAGDHSVVWDGRGADGRRVSAGIYFIRLNIGGQAATARLAVLR